MKKFTVCILLLIGIISCSSPEYYISQDGFSSNRALWVISIAELNVMSINNRNFPETYTIIQEYNSGQKGDHKENELLKQKALADGLEWSVVEYGYEWEPQMEIPFRQVDKYFNWWDTDQKSYDTLPMNFKIDTWYLLTRWQDSSKGGGSYKLFVYVTGGMEFKKYFDIQDGPW